MLPSAVGAGFARPKTVYYMYTGRQTLPLLVMI